MRPQCSLEVFVVVLVTPTPPTASSAESAATQSYSREAYRQFEANSLERHEYRDGEIVTMTGGSEAHNTITVNLVILLGFLLRDTDFRLYSSDLRLWLPAYNRGTYADVMVVEGQPEFHENRSDEILNPTLIVEVLSASTASYDRGDKFRRYRSLASFSEYLLVSQDEPYIEQFSRQDEEVWQFRSIEGLENAIALPRFNLELPLTDIYRRVQFPEPQPG